MFQANKTMFGTSSVNFQEQSFQQEFFQALYAYQDLYNDNSLSCLFKWPIFVMPNEVN